MKKIFLIFALGTLVSSCGSGPNACDCATNGMDPSSYDEDLAKECKEYADGLSDEDKAERGVQMLKCLED